MLTKQFVKNADLEMSAGDIDQSIASIVDLKPMTDPHSAQERDELDEVTDS
jgi:hypothetical protein